LNLRVISSPAWLQWFMRDDRLYSALANRRHEDQPKSIPID